MMIHDEEKGTHWRLVVMGDSLHDFIIDEEPEIEQIRRHVTQMLRFSTRTGFTFEIDVNEVTYISITKESHEQASSKIQDQ